LNDVTVLEGPRHSSWPGSDRSPTAEDAEPLVLTAPMALMALAKVQNIH
jgi:hypothetical protein